MMEVKSKMIIEYLYQKSQFIIFRIYQRIYQVRS